MENACSVCQEKNNSSSSKKEVLQIIISQKLPKRAIDFLDLLKFGLLLYKLAMYFLVSCSSLDQQFYLPSFLYLLTNLNQI